MHVYKCETGYIRVILDTRSSDYENYSLLGYNNM
jgi:hypothetical protein